MCPQSVFSSHKLGSEGCLFLNGCPAPIRFGTFAHNEVKRQNSDDHFPSNLWQAQVEPGQGKTDSEQSWTDSVESENLPVGYNSRNSAPDHGIERPVPSGTPGGRLRRMENGAHCWSDSDTMWYQIWTNQPICIAKSRVFPLKSYAGAMSWWFDTASRYWRNEKLGVSSWKDHAHTGPYRQIHRCLEYAYALCQ